MEASRSNWPDPRLDDLKDTVAVIDEKVTRLDEKVDHGFARLDARIDEGLGRLDGRIDETNSRIDGTNSRIDEMNQTMFQGLIALISIIAVLLTAFLTIVVTQL